MSDIMKTTRTIFYSWELLEMPSSVVSGIQQTPDQNTETALGTSGLEQALLGPPFLLETGSKVEDSEPPHFTDPSHSAVPSLQGPTP